MLGEAAKAKFYAPEPDGYACGWQVERDDAGRRRRSHHSGGVRGYGCQIARWLEEDILVVVLSNGKVSPHQIEAAVLEAVHTKT